MVSTPSIRPSKSSTTATSAQSVTASGSVSKLPPPKKRVSRACDECRLHKAKCDGATFCETCQRYNRVCSYNLLAVECKGSAARIRILEHRLVRARECITQLQDQLSPDVAIHIHTSLAPQSRSPLPNDSAPDLVATMSAHATSVRATSVRATSAPAAPASLLSSPITTKFPDLDLGLSLIHNLLQTLPDSDTLKFLIHSRLARSILCDTSPVDDTFSKRTCQLPPYDTMIEVVYVAFNSVFALCNVLTEHEFRITSQRLYDVDPVSYTSEDAEFVPLFCSVIALGMIHCSKLHDDLGYERVLKESFLYFEAASTSIANDQECATVTKLQTTLCLVLYLINTSQLDLARPALKIICASGMVQDLFRSFSPQTLASSPTSTTSTSSFSTFYFLSDMRKKDIVWSIIYLDMHVSSLLRVPSLLSEPGPEMATHILAFCLYSHGHELMKLVRRISLATPVVTPDPSTPISLLSSEGPEWTDLRRELGTWEFILRSVFPENENNPILCLVRHQLQCHLYLTEIILYLPYLSQHADSMAMRNPSHIDDMNKGRACVTAATNAIMYTSMYLEHTQTKTLSWHSAYVVFISLLALLVSTSFTDALGRHTIQHTIRVAVQTLSNSTYGSSRSKDSYLEFAQAVSFNLRPSVDLGIPHRSTFSSDVSFTLSSNIKSNKTGSQDVGSSSEGSTTSGPIHTKQWWLPILKEEPQELPDQWGFDHS